jgi:hypothetical protein
VSIALLSAGGSPAAAQEPSPEYDYTWTFACNPVPVPFTQPLTCVITVMDGWRGIPASDGELTGEILITHGEGRWQSGGSGYWGFDCAITQGRCTATYLPAASDVTSGPVRLSATLWPTEECYESLLGPPCPEPPTFDQDYRRVSVPVAKGISAISATCSPNPTTYPADTTCTATVTGAGPSPTRKVTWTENGAGQLVSTGCELVNGTCAVNYRPSVNDVGAARPVLVTAHYGGDDIYEPRETTVKVDVAR